MKTLFRIFAILSLVVSTAALAEGKHEHHRELGAHEHGHGKLNISTEGNIILVELEAPGADIYGFETKAESDEQKAAVTKANDLLKKPLELFDLGTAAGCKVENASVEAHQDKDHNEVHAEYALYCAKPKEIKNITFKYFTAFPNAAELEVKVVGSKGQKSYEVKKASPKLDLGGSL